MITIAILVPTFASAAPAACPSSPPQLGGTHVQVQPGAIGSLRCADLQGANLDGLDLRGFDLDQANLTRASLRNTDLSQADLTEATLTGTVLDGANLTGATLTGVAANGASFVGANLDQANAAQASMNSADFKKASFRQVDVSGTDLRTANFTGADVTNTSFTGAQLDASAQKSLSKAVGVPKPKITASDRLFSIGCPILFVIVVFAGVVLIRRRRTEFRKSLRSGDDASEAITTTAGLFTGGTAIRDYEAALEAHRRAEAAERAKVPDEPSDPTRLPGDR